MDKSKCASQHFGVWAIETKWLNNAVASIKSGLWAAESGSEDAEPYAINRDGIALIPIVGQVTKGVSSYGGTSSILTRQAIRKAVADPDVRGIMLQVDSPGGTVSGIQELADDVKAAGKTKPVHAYCEDLCASAAYWVASQASRVSANATAEIGSIGVYCDVVDSSGAYEAEGIKVHVVSSGDYKGAFAEGTEVTEEQLASLQETIDDLNEIFVSTVASGRKRSKSNVKQWANGKTWVGQRAQNLGLIDSVEPVEAAMKALNKEAKIVEGNRRRTAQLNKQKIILRQ